MPRRKSSHDENVRALARFFRNEHEVWPQFSHVLFECDDEASLDRLKGWLEPRIADLPHLNPVASMDGRLICVHLFYANDEDVEPIYLDLALSSFSCLARQGYSIEIEDPSNNSWELAFYKARRMMWPSFWMVMIHSYAQDGVCDKRLRTKRLPTWKGHDLPDGVTASELPCGVFLASALTLELDDLQDRLRLANELVFAARNKYCYERQQARATMGEIANEVREMFPEKYHFRNVKTVWKAIADHLKHNPENNLDRP